MVTPPLYWIYIGLIGLSTLLEVAMTAYAWGRWHHPGVRHYVLLNVLTVVTNILFVFSTLPIDPWWGELVVRLRFACFTFIPVMGVGFVHRFIRQPRWFKPWMMAVFWGVAAANAIVVLMPIFDGPNGLFDGLFFATFERVEVAGYFAEQRTNGPWYAVYLLYQLVVSPMVVFSMLDYAVRIGSHRRAEMLTGAVVCTTLMIANNLPITLGDPPGLRLTPLTIGMLAMVVGWVFWRYDMLAVIPIPYDQIINSVRDAVLVVNLHGVILTANPAAHQLLGRKHLVNLRVELATELPAALIESDQRTPYEFMHGRLWLEGQSYPLFNGARLMGRTVVLRDITRRKQAEREMLELAFERERGRILASFISDASHEFRTPITVIKSSLYLLNRADDPDKRQRHTDVIEGQVDRLMRLMGDLQKMAALDNQTELSLRPMDIGLLVHDAAARVRGLGWLVETSVRDIPLVCAIEPAELDHALARVLDNAMRYSLPDQRIEIRGYRHGQRARIDIIDHGEGMDADTLHQATLRFYRRDAARTGGGFGLGLPIARAIIALHGGALTIASTPHQGTTVSIELPLVDVSQDAVQQPALPTQA
jgi:signal transduction histidine kinase